MPAVHAADPARGEEPDPGTRGGAHAGGHRRGHAAFFSNRALASARRLQVVGCGKALTYDRRLESDYGPARLQCGGDLVGDAEQVAQLGRAPTSKTDCDAAWTPFSAASPGVAPCSHAT